MRREREGDGRWSRRRWGFLERGEGDRATAGSDDGKRERRRLPAVVGVGGWYLHGVLAGGWYLHGETGERKKGRIAVRVGFRRVHRRKKWGEGEREAVGSVVVWLELMEIMVVAGNNGGRERVVEEMGRGRLPTVKESEGGEAAAAI
ncbi:hypothetical protein HAX54_043125 [Datura stramonium]|uniref:Uncharacterized protein n=1 Tax=Datura stramonium TaxID=4076 RepID=A0ABS8SN33_DATST|nr:hypothetical protein [Datura stramonium]